MRRVVIVTGASGGIGEATARYFAARGWTVVLAARSEERLAEIAGEIRVGDGSTLVVPTDVTVPEDRARLVARTLETFGRIDALINNAGLGLAGTVATLDLDDLDYVFQLNVMAPVALIQAVVPVMRRQGGGVIVNVSSLTEALPVPYMAGYGASKAALGYLTTAAAVELDRDNIALVKVMPGMTATGFERHVLESGVGLSLEQLLAKANFMSAVPAERVAAAIWKSVQTRRCLRCLTWRDRLLGRFAAVMPRMTKTLLMAAVQRYILPSGEPSDADIKRDVRNLGLIVGGAAASLGALLAGIWIWVKEHTGRAS
ncbi:MAG: SDR family NAD(P)-dependent oxidoreductase [Anaerolineae bacterium]